MHQYFPKMFHPILWWMGPTVNEGKTKHMLSTSRDVNLIVYQITVDNNTFVIVVKEFIYLGRYSLEIKSRITLANRCHYALNGQLSSRDLSRTIKLILYKTLFLPVFPFSAEIQLRTDAATLREFERKWHIQLCHVVRMEKGSAAVGEKDDLGRTKSRKSSASWWRFLHPIQQ